MSDPLNASVPTFADMQRNDTSVNAIVIPDRNGRDLRPIPKTGSVLTVRDVLTEYEDRDQVPNARAMAARIVETEVQLTAERARADAAEARCKELDAELTRLRTRVAELEAVVLTHAEEP